MHLRLEILFLCAAAAVWVARAAGDELEPISHGCGILRSDQFHNHSNTTQINEFPWTCHILINSEKKCVGVLISSLYVVTVAHCVDYVRDNITAVGVVLGDWYSTNDDNDQDCDHHGRCSTPLRVDINRVVIHPHYNRYLHINDIALLRLKFVVPFSDDIRPICLPGAEVSLKEFKSNQLTLAGWVMYGDPTKLKMYTVVNNTLDCERKYHRQFMSETNLCAVGCINNETSFLSGSPLMDVAKNSQGNDYYYLAGLMSLGRPVCTFPAWPDIFVRVDNYRNWIVDYIWYEV